MTQGDLFDEEEGKRRRDEAVDRVEAAADDDWKDRALETLYRIACRSQTFSAEDAWEDGLEKPREPRALGGVMRQAVKLGYCEPTGTHRLSRMASHHAAPVRVYISRLYDQHTRVYQV